MHKLETLPGSWKGIVSSMQRETERRNNAQFLLLSGIRGTGNSLVKSQDLQIMAYLWMGLDAGLSILVSGDSATGIRTVISTLASMLHPRRKLFIVERYIENIHLEDKFSSMIGLYGPHYGITAKDLISKTDARNPDWVILDEISGIEAVHLFSTASMGVPFIAGINTDGEPAELIERLREKRMGVGAEGLCFLDLSVRVGASGHIEDIFDYNWLSRAEIYEGISIGEDEVLVRRMSDNGVIDASRLSDSKIIRCFGRAKGYPIDKCLIELQRRTEFLSRPASRRGMLCFDYAEAAEQL